MKIPFSCLLFFIPFFTLASPVTSIIKTHSPRGREIEVRVHIPIRFDRVLIIAPGKSCNYRNELFETLAAKASNLNTAVFRFEWEYCEKDPHHPNPSQSYKNEIEDLTTVLSLAAGKRSSPNQKIILAGKSMGSVLAYQVFRSQQGIDSLVLLTPLCSIVTDDHDRPLPQPVSVGEQYYPKIKEQSRAILFALGRKDDACTLPVLQDFLNDARSNIFVAAFAGDHGFRSFLPSGELDSELTQQTILRVTSTILKWAVKN